MFALVLSLLLQASTADTEAGKLVSGLDGLLRDPMANAEELDRRFTALKKVLEENPSFTNRSFILYQASRLGRKTARPLEALSFAKERLQSRPTGPGQLDMAYIDALYSATLAVKSEEALSVIRAWAKEEPASQFLRDREKAQRDAASLGKSASSVSLAPAEGSKVSWSTATKEKIVMLYFTASW